MGKKTRYDPLIEEPKIRKFWDEEKIYKFDPNKNGKIYSIDTPPPTISGEIHIGHAYSYCQQDFVIRYRRMAGYNVFYPFGTDNNGIPTERLVEREKGLKAKDIGRQQFVDLCLKTVQEEYIPKYINDLKNLALSCDYEIVYSTIDEHCRRISQWSFIDLYKKDRIYRKDAPAIWCPECQTGISQVECEDRHFSSIISTIIFKLDVTDLEIATTRPELLPACVAVFYHPNDTRYTHLERKSAKVPLFNFEVAIIPDRRADPEKETGLVMCCTFGDQTDMEWQKAYNLPIKTAITEDGRMTAIAGKYEGMTIKEARKKIIEDLKEQNLVIEQKSITHVVNVHERCKTEVEILKSKQWFVKYLDLRKTMLKWGEEMNWYPDHMKHRYDNWVKGLQWDWLISRQRYFGVPFPVWYCKKCDEVVIANENDLPVDPLKDKPPITECPSCKCNEFVPEQDILDTWATSALTPTIVCRLLPEELWDKIYPMSLRPQAHDIITFWLFNTVVKSQLHYNKLPFNDINISGFVTLKGEKIAKSKGNVIRPQDVMDRFGSDSIRYWAGKSKLGKDLDYDENDIVTALRFITKIFNAARFVFINIKESDFEKIKQNIELHETDRLFLARLNNIIEISTKAFDNYQYATAKKETETFFWQIFCDNYLEIVKKRIYEGTENERISAVYGLYYILLSITKMMAPITPYITEKLWQSHFRQYEKEKSIHISSWPKKIEIKENKNDSQKLDRFLDVISLIRQEKAKNQKPLTEQIYLTLDKETLMILRDVIEDLKAVSRAKEIKEGNLKIEFL